MLHQVDATPDIEPNADFALVYVVPDYPARRPKRCMDRSGSQFFAVTPRGLVLPCHAAATTTGLALSSVREESLSWIWAKHVVLRGLLGLEPGPSGQTHASIERR